MTDGDQCVGVKCVVVAAQPGPPPPGAGSAQDCEVRREARARVAPLSPALSSGAPGDLPGWGWATADKSTAGLGTWIGAGGAACQHSACSVPPPQPTTRPTCALTAACRPTGGGSCFRPSRPFERRGRWAAAPWAWRSVGPLCRSDTRPWAGRPGSVRCPPLGPVLGERTGRLAGPCPAPGRLAEEASPAQVLGSTLGPSLSLGTAGMTPSWPGAHPQPRIRARTGT